MKKSILTDSVIYLIITIIQSGTQLLLIPYLTRSLSVGEFANAELFLTAYGLLNLVILFGVNTQIFRDFAGSNIVSNINQIREYRVSIYRFFICLIFLVLSASLLTFQLFGDKYSYLVYAAICSAFFVFYVIESCFLQLQKRALSVLVFAVFFTVSSVLITVASIEIFELGYQSRCLGYIIPSISIFIYILVKNDISVVELLSLPEGFSKKIVLLLPLFVSSIFSWMAESADKIMISEMLTLEDVAFYSIGYKFGMIVLMLTVAYSRAWMPFVAEHISNQKLVFKALISSAVGLTLVTGLYLVVVSEVFEYIVPAEYQKSLPVVFVIASAYLVDGLAKLINSVFICAGKSHTYVSINILAGSLNLILNLVLIPKFGYLGAAYATLVSFTVSTLISIYYYYRMSVNISNDIVR